MSYELEKYESNSLDTFNNEPDIIEAEWTPVTTDIIDVEYEPIERTNSSVQDTNFDFIEPDINEYPVPYETGYLSPYEAVNNDYEIERHTAAYINTEPEVIDVPYAAVQTPQLEGTHTETSQEWINKQQVVSDAQVATYQQTQQDTYIAPYEVAKTQTHTNTYQQPQTQTQPLTPYQAPSYAPPVNQQPSNDSYEFSSDGEIGDNYPFWFGRKKSPNESDETWYLRHLWFQKHWDRGDAEFPEAEFHAWYASLRPWERGMFSAAGKQIADGDWRYGDRKKQDKIYEAIDNYYERVNAARNSDPVGMLFSRIRRLL